MCKISTQKLKKTAKFYVNKLIDYTQNGLERYITKYPKAKEHYSKVHTHVPIRHRLCDQGQLPVNAFLFIMSL